MIPRLIRSSSNSTRRLFGLSRSASASNTVQRDVKAIEHGEQHQDEPEEADDRRVHRSPLRPIAPAGRRARSETSSSSASRMKLAMIDEPP